MQTEQGSTMFDATADQMNEAQREADECGQEVAIVQSGREPGVYYMSGAALNALSRYDRVLAVVKPTAMREREKEMERLAMESARADEAAAIRAEREYWRRVDAELARDE